MTSKSFTDFSKVELDCRSGSEVVRSATVVGDTASDASLDGPRGTGDRETSIRRSLEVLLSLGSDEAIEQGTLGVTKIAELHHI